MENKLKPETCDVISTLNDSQLKTLMATGDNVLTAISVARQCKILEPTKPVYLGELEEHANGKKVVWSLQAPN